MLLGFDIGGTKCSVITAEWIKEEITILRKEKIETVFSVAPEEMLNRLMVLADGMLDKKPEAIGISCGGPLDSARGVILGPPNLPGWDHVEIVRLLQEHFGSPAYLQNDANACAVAEWKFGAGMGCDNLVFLTFGTGLRAGLILNGRLYTGASDNAGECGHIRLDRFGPVGYGKAGSFEGFCVADAGSGRGPRHHSEHRRSRGHRHDPALSPCAGEHPTGRHRKVQPSFFFRNHRPGQAHRWGLQGRAVPQSGMTVRFNGRNKADN